MTRKLPEKANLEHLKKQAKQLLKDHKAGEQQACNRIREYHLRLSKLPEKDIPGAEFSLQDAQLTVAREYGFSSWPKMVSAIKSTDKRKLIFNASNRGDLDEVKRLIKSYSFAKGELDEALCRATCNMRGDKESDFRACADYLIDRGADVNAESEDNYGRIILGSCEFLNPVGLKYLIDHGAIVNVPERITKYPANNTPLNMVLGTYSRKPAEKHRCLDLLIEAGAHYEDGPVMDIHMGRDDNLKERLNMNSHLLHAQFDLNYGNYLTLFGVSLLHIAAEYIEKACVDVLLDHGADIDEKAIIGKNGVGGQTPIYHVIGGNQGKCYPLFEHLMEKGPDLTVKAYIQGNVVINHEKDLAYDEVLELSPLGYALRYEHEPTWREASREAAKLRELGAPM